MSRGTPFLLLVSLAMLVYGFWNIYGRRARVSALVLSKGSRL